MPKLRALLPSLVILGTACASSPSLRGPLRESANAPPSAPGLGRTGPRIGAPGGSGAGSRAVTPTQSGNETVGGLPAGSGKGPGRRG